MWQRAVKFSHVHWEKKRKEGQWWLLPRPWVRTQGRGRSHHCPFLLSSFLSILYKPYHLLNPSSSFLNSFPSRKDKSSPATWEGRWVRPLRHTLLSIIYKWYLTLTGRGSGPQRCADGKWVRLRMQIYKNSRSTNWRGQLAHENSQTRIILQKSIILDSLLCARNNVNSLH